MQSVGLDCADDGQIWEHAKLHDFAVVTKDSDFSDLGVMRGTPPKVIWLQLGNCSTSQVENAFRARFADAEAFENDPNAGTLIVG